MSYKRYLKKDLRIGSSPQDKIWYEDYSVEVANRVNEQLLVSANRISNSEYFSASDDMELDDLNASKNKRRYRLVNDLQKLQKNFVDEVLRLNNKIENGLPNSIDFWIRDKIVYSTLVEFQGVVEKHFGSEDFENGIFKDKNSEVFKDKRKNEVYHKVCSLTRLGVAIADEISAIEVEGKEGQDVRRKARSLVFAKDFIESHVQILICELDESFSIEDKSILRKKINEIKVESINKLNSDDGIKQKSLEEVTKLIEKKAKNTKTDLRAVLTCATAGIKEVEELDSIAGERAVIASAQIQKTNLDLYISNKVADAKDGTEFLNAEDTRSLSLVLCNAKDILNVETDEVIIKDSKLTDQQKEVLFLEKAKLRFNTTMGQVCDVDVASIIAEYFKYEKIDSIGYNEDLRLYLADSYQQKAEGYAFHATCMLTGLVINENIDNRDIVENQVKNFSYLSGRFWAVFNDALDFIKSQAESVISKNISDIARDFNQPDGVRWTFPIGYLFENITKTEAEYLLNDVKQDIRKGDLSKLYAIISRAGLVDGFEGLCNNALQTSLRCLAEDMPDVDKKIKSILKQTLYSYENSRAHNYLREIGKKVNHKKIWEGLKSIFKYDNINHEFINSEDNTLSYLCDVLVNEEYSMKDILACLAEGKTSAKEDDFKAGGWVDIVISKFQYDSTDFKDLNIYVSTFEEDLKSSSDLNVFINCLYSEHSEMMDKYFIPPPDNLTVPLNKLNIVNSYPYKSYSEISDDDGEIHEIIESSSMSSEGDRVFIYFNDALLCRFKPENYNKVEEEVKIDESHFDFSDSENPEVDRAKVIASLDGINAEFKRLNTSANEERYLANIDDFFDVFQYDKFSIEHHRVYKEFISAVLDKIAGGKECVFERVGSIGDFGSEYMYAFTVDRDKLMEINKCNVKKDPNNSMDDIEQFNKKLNVAFLEVAKQYEKDGLLNLNLSKNTRVTPRYSL